MTKMMMRRTMEMKLTIEIEDKIKIQQILNVFETGSINGDYSNVTVFADGPGNIRQITYGRSQTTEYGLLKELLQMYISAKGKYSNDFIPYISVIEKKPLVDDKKFKNLLKLAGKTDPVMKETQDKFFDEFYWEPALTWAINNKFTYPLSMLAIYDSFIHSGGIPMFLRSRFKENVPLNGGSEKEWIKQYLEVRRDWLANHKSRPILRKTVYRPNNILNAIKNNDWELEKPFNANGIIVS